MRTRVAARIARTGTVISGELKSVGPRKLKTPIGPVFPKPPAVDVRLVLE